MIFKEAAPVFQEIGPFIYRERNTYSDFKYGIPVQQGQILSLKQRYSTRRPYDLAVQATFTSKLEPVADRGAGGNLDTPGHFVN